MDSSPANASPAHDPGNTVSPSPCSPVLELRDVTRAYRTARGAVTVLDRVSVTVAAGEFIGLTGPSGSGKTTFLNLAGLLDRPTAGTLLIEGVPAATLDEAAANAVRARRIGMVFQRFCLLSRRTALDNVMFRFRYADTPVGDARRLALEALDVVGLRAVADQPARLLSGGEMQRVAIARAIALPPALLLVDEPTGNLDAGAAEAVMQCFARLHARGITIILATHNTALLPASARHWICRDGGIHAAPGGGGA